MGFKWLLSHVFDVSLYLDHSHPYFYQSFACNILYCDFVYAHLLLGKVSSLSTLSIYVHRNAEFWNDCVSKANCFFRTCILSELMGNWYTRPSITIVNEDQQSKMNVTNPQNSCNKVISQNMMLVQVNTIIVTTHHAQTFWYCKGPDIGKMIVCDNSKCVIEWFHIDCLKNLFQKGNGIALTVERCQNLVNTQKV